MRRKGLPQASAAVCWSVTGSFPRPAGTQTTLWSVSISDLPGWMEGWREGEKKSAQHIFIHMLHVHREISHRKIPPCSIGLLLVFVFFYVWQTSN